jgi:hypothetical protein
MQVEFLKANDDRTWDTEVIDVPDDAIKPQLLHGSPKWMAAVLAWVHTNLDGTNQYRKVSFWAVYNEAPGA